MASHREVVPKALNTFIHNAVLSIFFLEVDEAEVPLTFKMVRQDTVKASCKKQ
jgi:hypothetical protein